MTAPSDEQKRIRDEYDTHLTKFTPVSDVSPAAVILNAEVRALIKRMGRRPSTVHDEVIELLHGARETAAV
ncbi:hypothetical protein [Roseisolibacter agri]|uniref:Uncharacterized protein n=1 Tax=Roseisolibacter agri TaxID=2014610 RepID=A0AA37VDF0_9BACT|nr:hypothetical protein [Roseisolibacter agri]GLC23564.1 hypothetical protein rosag_00770 [Roseisolibacter agri]